jgi:hypothetical protein
MNVHGSGGVCARPTPKRAAARKDQPVDLPGIKDRDLQIAVERCAFDGLPFHRRMIGQFFDALFDIHQFDPLFDTARAAPSLRNALCWIMSSLIYPEGGVLEIPAVCVRGFPESVTGSASAWVALEQVHGLERFLFGRSRGPSRDCATSKIARVYRDSSSMGQ